MIDADFTDADLAHQSVIVAAACIAQSAQGELTGKTIAELAAAVSDLAARVRTLTPTA